MLAPSTTVMTPLLRRLAASRPLISFWVATTDADVAGRDISELTDVAVQLGHERLAEAAHLGVAPPLRVEIRPALGPTDGQGGQRVLEDLLEREELEQPQIHGRVEAEPTLVGTDRAAHLHAEAPVELDLAAVVDPRDSEDDDPLGLRHAFQDLVRLKLGVFIENGLQGLVDLPDGLPELGLARVPGLDRRQCGLHVAVHYRKPLSPTVAT
jgi:hypothetical protein